MIRIISEFGFCYGVKNAVNGLIQIGKQFSKVYLTHPLVHNSLLNGKLMKGNNGFFYNGNEVLGPNDAVIYSAHGHPLEEEEPFKNIKSFDAICPLIVQRYHFLDKKEDGTDYYFLGKKNHQETLGFLSHYPFLKFLDVSLPLSEQLIGLKKEDSTFLVPQTTVSDSKYQEGVSFLGKHSTLKGSLSICQLYQKRFLECLAYLKNVDPNKSCFIVVGDNSSSNANEIYKGLKRAYPKLDGYIALTIKDLNTDQIKGKDIYLTSATSVSEEEVRNLEKELLSYSF